MRTYAADATTWREYIPHLPGDLRLPEDDLPTESWWSWDGLAVHLDRYEREGARETVIVVHGAGGYGRLLAPFGRLFAQQGANVVLPDLPGYGLTDVESGRMTYDRWVRCIADLVLAESARTGRPVRLFGMSMGGMLALHAAAVLPAGEVTAVGASTLMDPRDAAVRRGVGRFPLPAAILGIRIADGVRLPVPLIAPVERMSSIAAVNRLCRIDSQGGGNRVPYGFFRSWLTHTQADASRFDRCPVLLTHPEADRWTPPQWSRDVLDRIPASTRYVALPACEHLPAEQPGLDILKRTIVSWAND